MIKSTLHTKARGNVLFLVLIAVALFAALSYAVTQSSRSGGGTSNETAALAASQITQYLNGVRTAATRLVLNGVDPKELQFNDPGTFTGAAFNETKAIFSVNGGGAVYQAIPFKFFDGQTTDQVVKYSAAYYIPQVGSTNASNGTGNEIMGFVDDLTQSVCMAINKQLYNDSAVPVLTAALTISGVASNVLFVTSSAYTFPTSATAMGANDATPDTGSSPTSTLSTTWVNGKAAGCLRDDATGNYFYFHVLYER